MTPEEQALAAAVDAANPQALALLERVVNINSGSMNFAGVRAVGDVFRGELDALGFTTRWVDGAPFNRAGHLVAERPRDRSPRAADRTSRHRVRAGQSLSAFRAHR